MLDNLTSSCRGSRPAVNLSEDLAGASTKESDDAVYPQNGSSAWPSLSFYNSSMGLGDFSKIWKFLGENQIPAEYSEDEDDTPELIKPEDSQTDYPSSESPSSNELPMPSQSDDALIEPTDVAQAQPESPAIPFPLLKSASPDRKAHTKSIYEFSHLSMFANRSPSHCADTPFNYETHPLTNNHESARKGPPVFRRASFAKQAINSSVRDSLHPHHNGSPRYYSDSNIQSRSSRRTGKHQFRKSRSPPSEKLPSLSNHNATQPDPIPNIEDWKATQLSLLEPRPLSSMTAVPSLLDSAERNLSLRMRLLHDFAEDRAWICQPVQPANHTNAPKGIHVFIDFSNIQVGFINHLKKLQRSSPSSYSKPSPLSLRLALDSLILVLERGRPVRKRVLVSSEPSLPAFDTARVMGYETNILDKVQARGPFCPNDSAPLITSSSKRPDREPQFFGAQPTSWREQGVDELLQLKMAQSLIDCHSPSTLVLGTGDGARSQFSDGFGHMVRRALRRGWTVELCAWRDTISSVYRASLNRTLSCPRFLKKPPGVFRIIELDPYLHYLAEHRS